MCYLYNRLSAIRGLLQRYSALIALAIFMGNFLFVGYFALAYMRQHFTALMAVNVFCTTAQKYSISVALGMLVLHTRGDIGALRGFRLRHNRTVLLCFVINRVASCAPPLYAIALGYSKLPLLILLYLVIDFTVAIWAAIHAERWIQSIGYIPDAWRRLRIKLLQRASIV